GLTAMFPVISRKRLILAGGILAVTAGTAGGTVLATRPTAASLPPASNAQAAATPQATPGTTRPKHQGHGGFAVVTGRVTAKPTESSISVADPSGAVTTYAVSPRVKVS